MIKIAICDDNEKELNQAISACHDYIKIDPSIDVEINIYLNSKDLLTNVQSNNLYDIYLLDIYMPEISGLELASIIKEQKKKAEIIFLTSSMSHAIDAFTLNATHYIVKPYTKENFGMGLKKAMDNIKDEIQSQIVLKTKNGTERIEFRDIYYSETEGHIQKVYTTHNKVLAVRMSSIDLYHSLSQDKRFYKFGSSYILNLSKIREVNNQMIVMDNNDTLRMQRRHYKGLLEAYTEYSLRAY